MSKWSFERRVKVAMLLVLVSFIGMVVLILTGVFPWEGSLDELRPH